METIDKENIIEIVALYPQLEGTEEKVLNALKEMQKAEDEYFSLMNNARELKEKMDSARKVWYALSPLYKIKYGSKEIHEIKNKTNMRIINPTDYRNVKI